MRRLESTFVCRVDVIQKEPHVAPCGNWKTQRVVVDVAVHYNNRHPWISVGKLQDVVKAPWPLSKTQPYWRHNVIITNRAPGVVDARYPERDPHALV